MILSDFQTNGTNMAMCGGTSMSSFSHGARSDLAYFAPAELSHFVPSMTAMLSEVYPMDESGTSPERTFTGSLMSDENEIGMTDVEMEDDQRKVIKIENSEISSLINARSMSEYYNFSSSGDETKAHHFRKRGDIMLSQPKSLPDINCFIQDQNRIGISSASDSCESLNSKTIETTVSIAESSENSDEEPQSPVFTNLTVRSSISQHPFARRWSDNNLHVHSGSEFGDCMGFGYPEESHCVIKQEKGERIPAVSGFSSEPSLNRSDNIGSQTIHHHQHVAYRENPGDLTNSSECSQVLAPKLEKVDPTNIYLGHTSVTQAHPTPCLGLKIEPPQTDTPQTTFSHNPELHPSTHSPTANYPNNFITVTSLPCANHHNGEAVEGRIQYHHQHEQEQRIPKVENLVSNGSQDYSNQTCSYETLSYLDIENLVGPCIEEMKGIILKEVIKDVDVACSALQLCPDPRLWSEEQVKKWVNWTVNQYNLPFCDATSLEMSGQQLCDLSESEMRALAPKSGDFLHAHLEIWTTVVESSRKTSDDSRNNANTPCVTKQEEDDTARLARYFNQKPSFGPHNSEQSAMCGIRQDESAITVMTPNHTAGIHLWQFLKELLLQPQLYGQYIRWIDKENGIFKIEDSVEVARLWGIRKNRPAMNYDKLSRSIRQYYKKGIIKKTEVSQRLVYQFVKPVV